LELNWTTFALEIINFLVLVWLLKHFLYQPVKAVVARRRESITAQLDEAAARQQQAEELRSQYENRLADWESEREEARQGLQREIEDERERMLDGLQQELASEREKAAVLAQRQLEERVRENEARALEQGARFVARLVDGVASPELEARLLELLLRELKQLPPAQRDALHSLESDKAVPVMVLSAFPLGEEQKASLQQRIASLVPGSLAFEWREDRKLIAGLRITVGPWVIHANLHDELKTFAAIAYEQ
jgi:F-type H+-transporting ATPase subunit b